MLQEFPKFFPHSILHYLLAFSHLDYKIFLGGKGKFYKLVDDDGKNAKNIRAR
jgi:hypothetical protein